MTARSGLARTTAAWVLAAAALLCGCEVPLTEGRPFSCAHDGGPAGQCPGGWHCGLDSVCHDPTVASAAACWTDSDCGGGWHCGATGVCYDVADAGAVQCRVSQADCAPGWRCGREGTCHDRDAGAAYACASDPDCERGWRCGPDGACVDSSADALRAPPDPSTLVLRRLNPFFPDVPALVGISHQRTFTFPDATTSTGFSAAVLEQGKVQVIQSYSDVDRVPHLLVVPSLTAPVTSLAAAGPTVFGLDVNGLWSFSTADGSLQRPASFPPQIAGGELRLGDDYGREVPLVVGFADAGLSMYDPSTGSSTRLTGVRNALGAPERINDVTTLLESPGSEAGLVSAADGLFYVPPGSSSAVPVTSPAIPNARCAPATNTLGRVKGGPYSTGLNALALAAQVTLPDGRVQLAVLGRTTAAVASCGTLGGASIGPFDPCPGGGTLLDFWPTGGFISFGTVHHRTSVLARCRTAARDALWRIEVDDLDGLIGYADYTFAYSDNAPERVAQVSRASREGQFLDSRGRLIAVDSSGFRGPSLQQPPQTILGDSLTGMLALTADGVGVEYDPAVGMVRAPAVPASAPVPGLPRWAVSGNTVNAWRDPAFSEVAVLDLTSGAALASPDQVHALGIPFGDGGTALAVASGDTLWAGDVSGLLPVDVRGLPADGGVTHLRPRVVPFPRNPITGLTFVGANPDAGAAFALGYAVSHHRLFELRAANEVLWRSSEVELPSLGPVDVWTDGTRGRVGAEDGTVYALPSRVQIGQPFPDGGTTTSYAALCGHAYALSGGTLWQLAPDAPGSTTGRWREVDLRSVIPPFLSDPALQSGRLYATGRELLVVSGEGETYAVTDSCPGGAP